MKVIKNNKARKSNNACMVYFKQKKKNLSTATFVIIQKYLQVKHLIRTPRHSIKIFFYAAGFSSTLETPVVVETLSSCAVAHTSDGNFFSNACLYLGWLKNKKINNFEQQLVDQDYECWKRSLTSIIESNTYFFKGPLQKNKFIYSLFEN